LWGMYEGKTAMDMHVVASVRVADVMVKEVIAVDSVVTVREAVDLMNNYEIGCLVVLTGSRVDGIVTERDILKRVIGKSRDVNKTKIKEVMSRPVWVVSPNTALETALHTMLTRKIKKLPVVKEGRLIGLLTLTDIARFQPKLLNKFKTLLVKGETPRRIRKVVDCYIS